MTSSLLEVAGIVLVVAGLACWAVPLAMVVAGVALVAVGYQLGAPTVVHHPGVDRDEVRAR